MFDLDVAEGERGKDRVFILSLRHSTALWSADFVHSGKGFAGMALSERG